MFVVTDRGWVMFRFRKQKNIVERMFCSAFLSSFIMAFASTCGNFVDMMIVKQNPDLHALSAIGLAYPFFAITATLSGAIASGMTLILTENLGRGDFKKLNEVFAESLTFVLLASLIFTAALFIFIDPFVSLLVANESVPELIAPTKAYLRGLIIGTPALMCITVLTTGVQLDNGGKYVMLGGILCAISNILMDLICGWLHLDIFWIGLATSLSSYVNLAVLLIHFSRNEHIIRLKLSGINLKEIGYILTLGSDKILIRVIGIVRPIILNGMMISAGGSIAVSVLSVNNTLLNLLGVIGTGIATATAILSGIFYGELNAEDIKNTGVLAHRTINSFIVLIEALLLLFFRQTSYYFMGGNPEGESLLNFALVCTMFIIPLELVSYSRICYLQSVHRTMQSKAVNFLLNFAFLLFYSFVFVKIWGAKGVFVAFAASEATMLFLIQVFYSIKGRSILPGVTGYLSLDARFNLKPQDVIDIEIRDMNDVALLSEQIQLFCKGHKLEAKKCVFSGIVSEEYASNIVEYGFKSSAIEKKFDVRVVVSGGDVILRFRDSCANFDITQQFEKMREKDKKDPGNSIGLKIIRGFAKSVQYYRTLDVNTAIITM